MSDPQSDLVQIVYISRSTFPPLPAESGIEPSVARILVQSRINNVKRGLVGALYFGDGCFFQCLQGTAEAVDRLYAALLADPRHTDLKVLSRESIPRTTFATWSMKYVPLDNAMSILLDRLGLAGFDPYRFDDAAVDEVLQLLHTSAETGDTVPRDRSVDLPFVTTPSTVPSKSASTARWPLVVAAVAVALVAVIAWMLLRNA